MSNINKSNASLFEANNKLKAENSKQKHDLREKQIIIDELDTKIKLMAEADKMMSDFKRQIDEKSRTIMAMRE